MPRRSYSKTGHFCRVTFEIAFDAEPVAVSLCGDFNGWNRSDHPLTRRKDGKFSTTISLPAGRTYEYKYLVDGERWENDASADRYVSNAYGSENSLIEI